MITVITDKNNNITTPWTDDDDKGSIGADKYALRQKKLAIIITIIIIIIIIPIIVIVIVIVIVIMIIIY